MRLSSALAACLTFLSTTVSADSNLSEPLSSQQILPDTFKPPQVFQNVNLLRNTNLEKGYVRETVNVVIENIDSKPQDEYYIPFSAEVIDKVGGLEVRDKKNPGPAFKIEVAEYDTYRYEPCYCTFYEPPLNINLIKCCSVLPDNSPNSPRSKVSAHPFHNLPHPFSLRTITPKDSSSRQTIPTVYV